MSTRTNHHEFEAEEERRIFFEGVRLFNEKDFFEAHETWEDIWSVATGTKAKFYQGLIQAAVVLEHMRRDNPPGVQRVWRTMQQKFAVVPDEYMGLNIPRFVEGIRSVVADVLEMPTARGQRPHDVVIEWDPCDVPELVPAFDPWETGEGREEN